MIKDLTEKLKNSKETQNSNSKETQNLDKIKYSKNSRKINDLSIEISEINLRIATSAPGFWNDILNIFKYAYKSYIEKKISQLEKEDSIGSLSSVEQKYLAEDRQNIVKNIEPGLSNDNIEDGCVTIGEPSTNQKEKIVVPTKKVQSSKGDGPMNNGGSLNLNVNKIKQTKANIGKPGNNIIIKDIGVSSEDIKKQMVSITITDSMGRVKAPNTPLQNQTKQEKVIN